MNVSSVAAWRGLWLAAGVVLVGALLAGPVAAAKPTKCQVVDLATGATFATLQAAVDAASAGATLRVKGTCVGTTTINQDLAIVGKGNPGFGPATLDGGHAGRVLAITDGVVSVTGLTITGGTADSGGGVAMGYLYLKRTEVTIIDSVISGNTATRYGGGISNREGTLTLIDSTVSGNTASYGGGIYTMFGRLQLQGASSISENRAGRQGGGLYVDQHSHAILSGTTSVSDNTATDGGGIAAWGYTSLQDATSVRHNTATNRGGGIVNLEWYVSLSGTSSISHNSATNGGGVYNGTGTLDLSGTSSISHNSATNGGGVYNGQGPLTLHDASSISDNTAQNGGGIYSSGSGSLQDTSSVRHNTATIAGGGIYTINVGYGAMSLSGAATISDNAPDNCYPPGSVAGCASQPHPTA